MLVPGQIITQTRTLSQADFDRFARLSGDDNPIHVDPAFAARTRFGRTVSHGMLLYSLLRAAMSAAAPGAIQIEQQLMFPAPTYTDDELTIELRVLEAGTDGVLQLATTIRRGDGETVCQGEARLHWEGA